MWTRRNPAGWLGVKKAEQSATIAFPLRIRQPHSRKLQIARAPLVFSNWWFKFYHYHCSVWSEVIIRNEYEMTTPGYYYKLLLILREWFSSTWRLRFLQHRAMLLLTMPVLSNSYTLWLSACILATWMDNTHSVHLTCICYAYPSYPSPVYVAKVSWDVRGVSEILRYTSDLPLGDLGSSFLSETRLQSCSSCSLAPSCPVLLYPIFTTLHVFSPVLYLVFISIYEDSSMIYLYIPLACIVQ